MNNKLIFDVGMHKGEDTAFYLLLGYKVVAVEADPALVERAKSVFHQEISGGRLITENMAIAEQNGEMDFHISASSVWNSLNPNISNRMNQLQDTIRVPAVTLDELFKKHGTPYYCKIDIEGFDEVALRSLIGFPELPAFISAESECIGEGEQADDAKALEILLLLKQLGYTKFQLVDQYSLKSLTINKNRFSYSKNRDRLSRIKRKFIQPTSFHTRNPWNYNFPEGASGPFGPLLSGKWIDFGQAEKLLLKHRSDYFSSPFSNQFGFWCDWHAAL